MWKKFYRLNTESQLEEIFVLLQPLRRTLSLLDPNCSASGPRAERTTWKSTDARHISSSLAPDGCTRVYHVSQPLACLQLQGAIGAVYTTQRRITQLLLHHPEQKGHMAVPSQHQLE